jgi:hypothetical protein
MITLVREWFCKPSIERRPQLRPPTNVRKYNGQWVIVVRYYEDGTAIIVYEDDRLNVYHTVWSDRLK